MNKCPRKKRCIVVIVLMFEIILMFKNKSETVLGKDVYFMILFQSVCWMKWKTFLITSILFFIDYLFSKHNCFFIWTWNSFYEWMSFVKNLFFLMVLLEAYFSWVNMKKRLFTDDNLISDCTLEYVFRFCFFS
jgi:hypothetical protein